MTIPGVLVFDVDNTLYDFVDFFGPSFRSMMHAIAERERISEDVVIQSAREVYKDAGSLDYRLVVEHMNLFAGKSDNDLEKLVRLARVAFSRTRNKKLHLYDGMYDVLLSARAHGFKCIVVTNAPYYEVTSRLRSLKILSLFDGLVAWEGRASDESKSGFTRSFAERRAELALRFDFFHTTTRSNLKPSPYPFRRIAEHFGTARELFSIGDSIAKDLEPAKSVGMRTIWAKYGTIVDSKNFETVLQLTPWSESEIRLSVHRPLEPDFVAESPRDIAQILRLPLQADLFAEK